jgi:signal transduction histidine kinase
LEHNTTLEIELQKRELQLKIAHLEDIRKKQRDMTEITRAAIHRDLHDGIGSRLVATTYALRSGKLTREKLEESLLNCLRDIKSIMESESEQEVRSLQSLLFEYCSDMEEILADTGVRLTYSIPEDREFSLIGNRSNEILKMIQELLSNALKHSSACQIHVDMQISDSYLTITLSERAYDPVKMPLYQISEKNNTSSNTGLKSLELRAQSIGAAFIQKVEPNSRTSFIAIRMFVDRFLYLSDRYPDGREDRRLFLNSQISDLTW